MPFRNTSYIKVSQLEDACGPRMMDILKWGALPTNRGVHGTVFIQGGYVRITNEVTPHWVLKTKCWAKVQTQKYVSCSTSGLKPAWSNLWNWQSEQSSLWTWCKPRLAQAEGLYSLLLIVAVTWVCLLLRSVRICACMMMSAGVCDREFIKGKGVFGLTV